MPDKLKKKEESPIYGDLTELNTCRLILATVGESTLKEITRNHLDLMGTSGAIYEANGDYAQGIFSSGWCQYLDRASWKLCNTDDNITALNSGNWICHECCWNQASLESIKTREPVDIECKGGIRLYAVPVIAGDKAIGSMNMGYGDPPSDPEKLLEISNRYQVDFDVLFRLAKEYISRPPQIVSAAKSQLITSAKLIGQIIEHQQTLGSLQKTTHDLGERVKELNCLYEISRLIEKENVTLDEILQGTSEIIPSSWQYPEIACARIIFKQREYKTANFKKTTWKQSQDFLVHGESLGKIEVFYLKEQPDDFEGPFLKEERDLINAIAEHLGRDIERKHAESELKRAHDELEKKVMERTLELKITNEQLEQELQERKHAEKALLQSEERHAEAQSMAQIGHWELNLVTKELFWSDENYKIFEIDKEKFGASYEAFLDMVHPDDRDYVNKAYTDSVKNKSEYDIVHRFLFEGDRIKYVHERCRTEYDEQKNPLRSIGTTQDITCLKAAEEEKERSLRFLQTVIDGVPDSLIVINKDYTIALANRKARQMAKNDPVTGGLTCHQVFHNCATPCDGNGHLCPLKKVIRTKAPVVVEHNHFSNQNQQINVELIAAPILDEKEEVFQIIELSRDITNSKQAEKEKKNLEDQLQQSQKMEAIGTLAGGIAHDFNNILAAILGYTELAISDLPDKSEKKQNLRQVLKAGIRAEKLVQQILTFSRKSHQKIQPVQIQLVVREAVKLLRSSIPATIAIKKDIDQNCDTVLADPTQIHQVVMNLCTNAYHAMRNTGGILSVTLQQVELRSQDPGDKIHLIPGSYLKLMIGDTGTGITKEEQEKIFEPYFTTKKHGEGTGLGLAVVHGIITRLHGDISVSSKPGKGTTFIVYLPVDKKKKKLDRLKITRPVPTGNERILLVDDEKVIVQLYKKLIETLGYEVVALTSSIDALDTFQKKSHGFDLIITDMTMPDMNGEQLAKQIFKIRADMPIILCTGYSELINPDQAKAMGISGYVTKPIIKRVLAHTIRKVLDKKTDSYEKKLISYTK
ncbi:MAG: ATP-binding protein [Desulfobacula sp.]|nr:ATP-binding protein [Desulfobacula sp.]